MSYDSTITITNTTGYALTLGDCTPNFGKWQIAPTDVPDTNPSSITFKLTADPTHSNGSQATVNYTVAGGSNQQFSISFRCNSSNDNYVTAGGTLTGLTVTPLYSAAMVLAMHPLIDTETVSQAPPPFKGH